MDVVGYSLGKKYTDGKVKIVDDKLKSTNTQLNEVVKEATTFKITSNETFLMDISYLKKNGWVFVAYDVARVDGTPIANNTNLFTLPVGFRHLESSAIMTVSTQGMGENKTSIPIVIWSSGAFQASKTAPNKDKLKGSIVYYAGGGTL